MSEIKWKYIQDEAFSRWEKWNLLLEHFLISWLMNHLRLWNVNDRPNNFSNYYKRYSKYVKFRWNTEKKKISLKSPQISVI